jgi:hypothetical protein
VTTIVSKYRGCYRVVACAYYNAHKRPATQYQPGDLVLLQRKFIQSRRINSKLDYQYLGPFRVIEMVGKNAVWLDSTREYPKLHPVFNVSLLARYQPPSQIADRRVVEGVKNSYYDSGRVVDWSKLYQILDACPVKGRTRKGKFKFLLRWRNSTPGEDTWVLEDHIPANFKNILQNYLI